jgi:HEAT repeat protein
MHTLTRKLYSTQIGNTYYGPTIETQQEVRERLLAIAYESTSGRNRVVQALIDLLNDTVTKEANSTAWNVGTNLLGQLKATEAIDLLVTYIDYSDGVTGLSLGHIPSAWALAEIGDPAVAKLIDALLNGKSVLFDNNARLREGAARALGRIGGIEAKQALKQALAVETDKTVIFYIKGALRTMSEQPRRKRNMRPLLRA